MEIIFKKTELATAAMKFIEQIGPIKTIAFHGEMGAGKTTFILAVCQVLGVDADMGSPTFSIINEYLNNKNESIYHIDLYRLKDGQDAMQAGVADCIDSGSYCFVEWPERAPGLFGDETIRCSIKTIDSETRSLEF